MKIIKAITTTVCMLAMTFILPSCSDKSDDPDDSTSEETSLGMISPDIFSGDWILQSFTEADSGNTTTINKEFTILPFTTIQSGDNIVKVGNYEYWAENFDALTTASTTNQLSTWGGTIGFCNTTGGSLKDAKVYEFAMIIPDDDST